MRSLTVVICMVCVLAAVPGFAGLASAQVSVVRGGDENPMLTVAKSTFWGSVTGLLVGGAIAVVIEENKSDQVKWGFVVGTLGGCAFGFHHVMTREPPTTGLLDLGPDGPAWSLPDIRVVVETTAPSPELVPGATHFGVRVPLVTLSF